MDFNKYWMWTKVLIFSSCPLKKNKKQSKDRSWSKPKKVKLLFNKYSLCYLKLKLLSLLCFRPCGRAVHHRRVETNCLEDPACCWSPPTRNVNYWLKTDKSFFTFQHFHRRLSLSLSFLRLQLATWRKYKLNKLQTQCCDQSIRKSPTSLRPSHWSRCRTYGRSAPSATDL